METAFFIFVILLVTISIWEYFAGKVMDIAFTGILTWRQEVQRKFIRIIFTQLILWIFLLTLIFVTYGIIFKTGFVDLRKVRTYVIIIFVLIVFPVAIVRKKFASWVTNTAMNRGKK